MHQHVDIDNKIPHIRGQYLLSYFDYADDGVYLQHNLDLYVNHVYDYQEHVDEYVAIADHAIFKMIKRG